MAWPEWAGLGGYLVFTWVLVFVVWRWCGLGGYRTPRDAEVWKWMSLGIQREVEEDERRESRGWLVYGLTVCTVTVIAAWVLGILLAHLPPRQVVVQIVTGSAGG